MIRHIVAWKFNEYAGGASAMENAMEQKAAGGIETAICRGWCL